MTETQLAILGLERILGKKKLTINKTDITKGVNLPNVISKLVKELLTNNLEKAQFSELTSSDYSWVAEILENIEHDLTSLSLQDEIDVAAIINIRQLLRNELPTNDIIDSPLGYKDLQGNTPKSEELKFMWTARVVDNPLHIFELLRSKQLTSRDVETLLAFYPTIHQFIIGEIVNYLVENKQSITRGLNLNLSKLLGVPLINEKVLAQYQNKPEPPKPSQTPIKVPQSKEEMESI